MTTSNSRETNRCSIYLLDGGLGTTLVDNYHCIFDDSTPLWSSQLLLTDPATLSAVQGAFSEAGADVILTATYQASYEGFARSGVAETEAAESMRSAVQIARKARVEGKGKVALSLGAYGATMIPSQEYSGKYDEDRVTSRQLRDWHHRRLDVFLPGPMGDGGCWEGVDMVAFETLPRIEEVWAAREVMAGIPHASKREFWITCVFPGEDNVLPDGSSVDAAVKAMLGKSAESQVPMGIGINCTRVGKVEALIIEFEEAVKQLVHTGEAEWPALVVYPDGTMGEVYNTVTKEWEKGQSNDQVGSWDETLFEIIKRASERGSWKSIFVGGCCKTTPDDIGKLKARIDEI